MMNRRKMFIISSGRKWIPFQKFRKLIIVDFFIDDYPHDKSIALPSQTSMICFVFFSSWQRNSWHNVTLLENVYVSGNYWKMMLFLISILRGVVVIKKLDTDMQEGTGISQLISPSCCRHFSARRHNAICVYFFFFFFNHLTAIPVQSGAVIPRRCWVSLLSQGRCPLPHVNFFLIRRKSANTFCHCCTNQKRKNRVLSHFQNYIPYFKGSSSETLWVPIPLQWCTTLETHAENSMSCCPPYL